MPLQCSELRFAVTEEIAIVVNVVGKDDNVGRERGPTLLAATLKKASKSDATIALITGKTPAPLTV